MARYDEQIAGRLMHDLMADFGLNRQQAAGIVGNLAHESGGFKNLQEDKPIIPGSRGGFGYAQWTASRRRNFEKFVGEKDWDIRSYQANYGNLKRELKGEYAYVIDRIKGVTTSKEAAKIFQDKFERPHKDHQHTARRAQLAADILVNPKAGFVAPFPTKRGVSQQTDLVRRQMLDPHSGNMGIAPRQEPAWSDQFAPGGPGLLGAPQITPPAPQGSQPTRSDFPTGPLNPEPWQDQFAPAPQYAPRTASQERFDETFTRSIPMGPKAPSLTPGTSNTAQVAAYRGLADSMAQAGVGSIGGRYAEQSPEGRSRFGAPHLEHGLSTPTMPSNLYAVAGAPAINPMDAYKQYGATRVAAPLAPIQHPAALPTKEPKPGAPPPLPVQAPRIQATERRVPTQAEIHAADPFGMKKTAAALAKVGGARKTKPGQQQAGNMLAGGILGGLLLGPLGGLLGARVGKSIANRQNTTFFPQAPLPPLSANYYPAAPLPPAVPTFNGGPGANGLSGYGNGVADNSEQFSGAMSRGGLGLY